MGDTPNSVPGWPVGPAESEQHQPFRAVRPPASLDRGRVGQERSERCNCWDRDPKPDVNFAVPAQDVLLEAKPCPKRHTAPEPWGRGLSNAGVLFANPRPGPTSNTHRPNESEPERRQG